MLQAEAETESRSLVRARGRTMADVIFTARAYCKLVLHAAKYPHCSINGLLLGRRSDANNNLLIVDAVPLFHICLNVSPMAEIALAQVDQIAASQDLAIAGYYMANENISDSSIERPSHRIADKIAEVFPSACLVIVDNKHLSLNMKSPAIIVSQNVDGKWKCVEPKSVSVEREILRTTSKLLEQRAFQLLIDFDNHLDDISQDWQNERINQLIDNTIAG